MVIDYLTYKIFLYIYMYTRPLGVLIGGLPHILTCSTLILSLFSSPSSLSISLTKTKNKKIKRKKERMSNLSIVEVNLPAGFRFHPKDAELICDYLMKKVARCEQPPTLIEVDLNKCEPWDIPG